MAEDRPSSGGGGPDTGDHPPRDRAIYRRPEVTASISALRDLNLSDTEAVELESWVRATRPAAGRPPA